MPLPIPNLFASDSGNVPASQLDANFNAINTSLTTIDTIASATTTDLGTKATNNIQVTGTANIVSFGSSAVADQPLFFLEFTGACTLVYDATAMILPTAANITAAAGDSAVAWYLGSGNWRVISYTRESGNSLVSTQFPGAESAVTAAATTDLGALATNLALINGNTGITSFGSSASVNNPLFFIRFSGTPVLTYNATSMILPTAANITVAAGDTAVAQYLGSGHWKIVDYLRASGAALAGSGGAFTTLATSPEQAIGSNGTNATWAHGLSGVPTTVRAVIRCKTAELNWSIGDEVVVTQDRGDNYGIQFGANSTVVKWIIGSNGIDVFNYNTGTVAAITPGNWAIVIYAAL